MRRYEGTKLQILQYYLTPSSLAESHGACRLTLPTRLFEKTVALSFGSPVATSSFSISVVPRPIFLFLGSSVGVALDKRLPGANRAVGRVMSAPVGRL
jgi:hypothetical protein